MARDKEEKSGENGKNGESALIAYMMQLVNDEVPPGIPPAFAEDPHIHALHARMLMLREALEALSSGTLEQRIDEDGYVLDACKSLQTNLCHLARMARQLLEGDYCHGPDTFGEISLAFNSTASAMSAMTKQLYAKEEALLNLCKVFQGEVRRNTEKRAAIVKELKESETAFKYQAQHDPLTGIFNRRSFFSLVMEKVQSLRDRRKEACLALLDIDHFKRFNDTLGHAAGDEALKHVVQCAKTCLRQSDCIARHGGEEFIFFLSEADLTQGLRIAERIRTAIAEAPYILSPKQRIPITASIGVSAVPMKGPESVPELVQNAVNLADKALYTAKKKGRNLVETII